MTSAAYPLQVGMAAALEADGPLTALLFSAQSIYSLRAPDLAKRPYIILGSSTEIPDRLFSRQGVASEETLHIWGAKRDKLDVLQIYAELARVLNAGFAVAGFTARRGVSKLIMVLLDPEDGLGHGVVGYSGSFYP